MAILFKRGESDKIEGFKTKDDGKIHLTYTGL